MAGSSEDAALIRLAEPAPRAPRDVALVPDAEARRRLARALGIDAVRKLRFQGRLAPEGTRDWRLTGHMGATVVQPCVVSLAPVTTRIESDISRLYAAGFTDPTEAEAEMPEDEVEALPDVLDLAEVIAEALALALPLYPRADGVELGEAVFTDPGTQPMRDEDARPFAGLKALKPDGDDPGNTG